MIHIVHNTADIETLQQAIVLDETLIGDILQIKDDFAVGPLQDIYTNEGREARKDWWRKTLSGGDLDGKIDEEGVSDNAAIILLKKKLTDNPKEKVWIWVAPNKHDVCSYFWLVSQLMDFEGRIEVLHLNNLPFLNEKGNIFYPEWLHEIPAKEFLKAKKLARPVTISEFELDTDEWNKICNAESGIRLYEGVKKITTHPINYYDNDLRRFVMPQWQKASKIITNYLNKAQHKTGDMFLLWRLKEMINQDLFDVQGKILSMKDFELKNKGSVVSNIVVEEEVES